MRRLARAAADEEPPLMEKDGLLTSARVRQYSKQNL
jgi:hypothetical protein